MRSLSQETVLQRLLQCESFPRGAALHKLPQHRSLPRGAVLQEQAAPAWVPTGSQPPSGIHLLWWGVPSTGYRWISAPPWTSTDCRGTAYITMVFITSCKGKLSAPAFQAPPHPSFFTDLGVCRVVYLTSSHSSLLTAVSPLSFFLPLLNYVIPEVLPPLLTGLALASSTSVLEPAGTGFIRPGRSFSQLLTEATPTAPPLPKPCHANP